MEHNFRTSNSYNEKDVYTLGNDEFINLTKTFQFFEEIPLAYYVCGAVYKEANEYDYCPKCGERIGPYENT